MFQLNSMAAIAVSAASVIVIRARRQTDQLARGQAMRTARTASAVSAAAMAAPQSPTPNSPGQCANTTQSSAIALWK